MDETIKRLQDTLLQMLRDFDSVCRKHNIKYMLFAGTALGAIRHKGFIPWDDDLDIIMLRSEYDRFMELAPAELSSEKYYLQKEYSPHWPMFFSKLRLNNTSAIEKYHVKDMQMHQGIYIDIFPCDNLSNNKFVRKLQFYASKIIIAKSLYKRGYVTDSFAKKIFMEFCRIIPLMPVWNFCVNRNSNETAMCHSFLGGGKDYKKSIYKREWMEEIIDTEFEDVIFPISEYYHELLSTLYGDYMKMPCEEDRECKKHIEILDFDKNYTEYLEYQKNMKIDTYTRSIR